MKKGKFITKLSAVMLAVVMLITAMPSAVFALGDSDLRFAVISDVHYFNEADMGNKTADFEEWAMQGNKQYMFQEGLIESALAAFAAHAEENGLKYVLMPGDLTMNGEYSGHSALAARLERFEAETGLEVIVANGNHDINNSKASTFKNDVAEYSRATTPEEFKEIYKNLGYDIAYHTFAPSSGKAGMLSYSVQLEGGYRLIMMDGGKYSSDNTESGEDEHETGGNYTAQLMQWILSEIADAKAHGETPIGLTHWSIYPHYDAQEDILNGFVIDNFREVSETLADAGMHYVFTGHSHANDISSHVSDNGEIIYDCQTNAFIEFPNYFREVTFSKDAEKITADYELFDVDCVLPVTANGVTYEQPYRVTQSFNYTYKGGDVGAYLSGMACPWLEYLFEDITEQGGLVKYLASSGIDIEGILKQYIGDGIFLGDKDIVTPNNLMAFVNDLGSQIDKRYIENPEYTLGIVRNAIQTLCDYPVSEYPCTFFLEEYGVGDPAKPGTFGDAVLIAMYSMWSGDEDIEDDVFMQDVLYQFEYGDLVYKILDLLIELLVNDVVQDEILSNLYVNVDTFFNNTPYEQAGSFVQIALDLITSLFGTDKASAEDALKAIIGDGSQTAAEGYQGRTTYLQLVNLVLKVLDKTGTLEGGSVNGVLDVLMEEYLTDSQMEAVGYLFARVIEDFATDNDPGAQMDGFASLSYEGKLPVVPTADDFRLPSTVSVTLGNDASTSRSISWYTKYSVTGTDIEIVPYAELPVFTGIPSTGKNIKASVELVTRTYPGVDLGALGIMSNDMKLNHHTISITGLEPGTKYSYRIGDAEKGWWSAPAVIETADNSDAFTFLYMTDLQGQNPVQYTQVKQVIDKAFEMYPEAKFIASTGDQVDKGDNLKHWKMLFNISSDKLMSVPFMPTAGNHEEKGEYALEQNFVLPNVPSQDTITGTYYSFDYNNAHFTVLNTNDLSDDNALSDAQTEWLKADVEGSDADWNIVMLHKAVYSNGSHYDDKDVKALREQLSVLMPQLGIDVVLQGHDHVYLRTDVMANNEVVSGETKTVTFNGNDYVSTLDPSGSFYVIGATGGVKNYVAKDASETDELFPRAQAIVDTSLSVFSAITIDGRNLYFDAYTVDTENDTTQRIDSFAIEKSPAPVGILLGDVDFDGLVTAADARIILRCATGLESLSEDAFVAADVDFKDGITAADARAVLRVAAKLESFENEYVYY
ncbi:MAG: hypothetical protein GX051_09635 [Clostridiales bacterium]|nr:hypothetical protein [Clostridiales bacterium]